MFTEEQFTSHSEGHNSFGKNHKFNSGQSQLTQPQDKCYIFLNDLAFLFDTRKYPLKKTLTCTNAIDSIAPLHTASLIPAKASWEKACSIQRLKLDCIVRTHMSNHLHPSLMKWTSLPLRSGQDSKENKKWNLWGKNKIVWAFRANCQNAVEEGKNIRDNLWKSVHDYLLDHLTETNQTMILKYRLSSFCQKE